nr:uncharacterized protein LOC111833710 isoform X2 [Paramormyrops kingsleyae]
MLGCLRAAVLTCFLWMHLPATELSFTAPPEDLVGLPDGPLVLPCPVYSPNQKGAETVHWERGSGSSLPGPEERIHQLSNGSLFFSRLLEGDFGIYLCQVQDGTDRIRATVRVKKAGMEAVFFSPKSQLVPEGDSVFLQCISGDSRPPAHITWEKDGSPVTKGNQIQGQYGGGSHLKTTGTLYLADVSKDDEGEYICVTHNPLLSIRLQSAVATLTVQAHHAAPKIIKGPENITVATDTEASLHCAIQGFPLPMVHWFKNSVPLQNDSRWSFSNSGQLLVFSKVSEEDEGFYHCEARGLKTSVRSQPAYLQTAEMEWSFMQQPVNTTAQAGDSVTLICKPPRSRPPARITWFKNARPLTQKPHFSQLPSGDLLFHRLQEADRGSYFCRASNSLLPRAVSSRKAYLNVQAPPSVMLWPKLVTAVLGSRVTLHCQVSGYPLPRITWSKQGRSVQTGGRVTLGISNATLYFSSVKAYDEGSYTCHATNTIGRAQGTASVRVAVSPVIISFPREVRSSVGVSVVLPCQAVGSSPMRYTWNQGPGHTPISSSSRIRVDEDGMLNITRLERADAGEYHCIAENVAGWDRRTANIIVLAEENATERGIVSTATLMGCTPFQSLLSNYKCQQNMNISTSTGRTLADRMLVNGSLPEVTTRGTKTAGSIKIHNSSESPGFRSSRLTPEDIWSVVRPRDITDHPAQGPASSSGFVWIPAILSESATAQVTQRDRRVRATPVFSPGSEQALVYEKTASQMTLGLSELGRGHFAPGLPPSFHLQPAELQTPPSEVYSPPAFSHSRSTKNQIPPTFRYSSPNFFHSTLHDNQSPPSYQHTPPTTFQSLSTENQTPPPDLYSPPTTFQSLSTENQTPPPDLYSPPTTFQSLSTENQTPPPDLYSPPTTFQSLSTENQTPPPDLYSPPTTFQSLSSKDQTSLPDLYSPPTTFQSLSTENQTPPPDLYSPPTSFQFQSPEASPDYLYIPHVNLLSLAPGLHTSHPVAPTQSTKPLTTSIGPVLSRKDDIISTVPKLQDWNRPTRPDKPSNTELTEWPRKNTSQAPMRTSDDTARVKQHHPLSWFPALEKHDIPIVVGVGVSLTFIFITMAFYSLVQKNDPALAGRGAQRGLGAPCRRGGRLEIRRTYENRAFEDDDFVAVIEQSPDAFGTRAPLPTPGAKTGMTESPGETQPAPASPVPAQLDTEHRNELQMVCRSEREKHPPSPQPNMRLGDSEHWRPCPDPLPLPASPKPSREDGLHTSLTLQTSEAFTTPVSHSVNISHASGPLLLSHCISMGVTTVAVDVHFYPSAPTPPPPPPGSRLADSPESDRVTPSMQCEHRVCL